METKEITCAIVDDELQIRDRLESLLMKFDNVRILFKEGIPEKAIEKVVASSPDIVFIDVEMPRMNGFEVVKAIREKFCHPTFIFVTAYNQYAIKAIKNGAFDYLLKPIDIDELSNTLKRYQQLHRQEAIMEIPLFSCLSKREKEVLGMVIKGYSSVQIAEKLFISKATVDSHRKNILEKTGAAKLSDLIIKILSGHS